MYKEHDRRERTECCGADDAEPQQGNVPLHPHDAEEEERYRALRGGDAHDAYRLTDSFPHDGFGMVKSKALDFCSLLADSVHYTFRCCCCETYERCLALVRAGQDNKEGGRERHEPS